MVSFTGSQFAGQKVMEAASKNIIKVNLELGGKAPAIVLDDADLELAATAVVNSRIINSGQVCNCAERIYVQSSIKEQFVQKLVEKMQAVKYGNPLEQQDIDMGPMVNEKGLHKVQEMVTHALHQGGNLVLGGNVVEGTGYYFEPTIIDNVDNSMDIMRHEILVRSFRLRHLIPLMKRFA